MFDNVKQSWQKKKGIHPTPTLYLEVGEFSLAFVKDFSLFAVFLPIPQSSVCTV